MNWTTTIVREAPDKLSKVEWHFALSDHQGLRMQLRRYGEYARETRRHGYKEGRRWSALDGKWEWCPPAFIARPEPPDDVKAEARQRLNDALMFT